MTWITQLQSDFTIKTGEGSTFSPQWLNATHQTSYNIASFVFPNVDGTLVQRKKPKGNKFNLEIYFQGNTHLTQSQAFETAAKDPRPWRIAHPFYGEILVQPSTLNFDNTKYNLTKITGTILETIDFDGIRVETSIVEDIQIKAEDVNVASAAQMQLLDFEVSQATVLKVENDNAFERFKKAVATEEQLEGITNAYKEANAALDNIIISPVLATRKATNLLTLPYTWELDINTRFNALRSEFYALLTALGLRKSVSSKKYFESQGVALMTAICNTAVTPLPGDYNTRTDVENMIQNIINVENDFIDSLDQLADFDYTPKQEIFNDLDDLINLTLSKLFEIAIGAKQEMTFILTEDSNVVSLTHRFIGLDDTDENLDNFININKVGLNEILLLKKGRKVLYYV